MATLLVIEDEDVLGKHIRRALQKQGHQVLLATTAAEGERLFAAESPDLVLLDLRLPDASGLEVLRRLRARRPDVCVLMMTAYATVEDAVEAIKLGARDYLQKPLHMDDLRHAVGRALEETDLRQEVSYHRHRQARGTGVEDIQGDCAEIQTLRTRIGRLCSLPADAAPPTVLITGPTGVGKGLVARVLHYNGPRAERPFIAINCAAIPENLVESELFGYERGAFTDARANRTGLFQAANKGTLFLDEVGCIPLATQVKLLRAIEERAVRPLGAQSERPVDVQVVAATNADLQADVQAGSFREDLYFRLRVATLEVPPLASRGEDVLLLAGRFLAEIASGYRLRDVRLAPDAEAAILAHRWPGNVRELRNTLDRAVLFSDGPVVHAAALGLPAATGSSGAPAVAPGAPIEIPDEGISFDEVERSLLVAAMRKADGNQSAAARLLGMSRDTLRYRLEKFEIESPK